MQAIIPNQTQLTEICSEGARTRTQHCMSKYHSAGLVNSQVCALQTEPGAPANRDETGDRGSVEPGRTQTAVVFRARATGDTVYTAERRVPSSACLVAAVRYHTSDSLAADVQLSWFLIMLIQLQSRK